MSETYLSNCCGEPIPDYPDSDICPKCGEHCAGMTQEDIDREEGEDGRLLK